MNACTVVKNQQPQHQQRHRHQYHNHQLKLHHELVLKNVSDLQFIRKSTSNELSFLLLNFAFLNTPTAFRQEDCLLGADVGPCRAMEHRYYYNSQDGLCDVFGYGGCEGNNNNFQSFDECDSKCGAVQDPCSLPAIYGRCQENITRFHYDSQRGECLPFEYSGCRGNKNNFYSIRDCQAQCQRQQPQVQPQHVRKNTNQAFTFQAFAYNVCFISLRFRKCSHQETNYAVLRLRNVILLVARMVFLDHTMAMSANDANVKIHAETINVRMILGALLIFDQMINIANHLFQSADTVC